MLPKDDGEYRTLAGFVLSMFGSIPVTGDDVDCIMDGGAWHFEVTRMEGHRIDEVALRKTER